QESIAQELGNRNRGVKEGWYMMDPKNGPDYFLAETNCPAVITEFYFLDNAEERERYAGNVCFYNNIAERVSTGILSWFNQ
ncbi:MAG: N-acetylmuramoyl-L-alanine amidase, partial [Spirochaetales bacterium]|nr:N-acetylmuramoyl-L-alanine amidase [Spirochaetales bacterium]